MSKLMIVLVVLLSLAVAGMFLVNNINLIIISSVEMSY